jgi:hypothetical protein
MNGVERRTEALGYRVTSLQVAEIGPDPRSIRLALDDNLSSASLTPGLSSTAKSQRAEEPTIFLWPGLRETVYGNPTVLAIRELQILPSTHGDQSGLIGSAAMILDDVLSARAVDAALSQHRFGAISG